MDPNQLILTQPQFTVSTLNGRSTRDTVAPLVTYPQYLKGTWQVTQTLEQVQAPLGVQYAGGPNGIAAIGEQSIAQAKAQLSIPVSLQLRYLAVPTVASDAKQDNAPVVVVVEDRLFNTQQRFNSFAGKSVVARVVYANEAAATASNNDLPTTTTTITYFKGPAAQKTFVTAHHDAFAIPPTVNAAEPQPWCSDANYASWTGFECQRSLFALTNANTAPPIPTDSELLFSYRLDDCRNLNHVTGRLRIASYLNPLDSLYFAARQRAVTIQDYVLDLQKISD
jgi:hypothetical protein